MQYYVYELINSRDGSPFYVGKTNELRVRLRNHLLEANTLHGKQWNALKCSTIRKIIASGERVLIIVVARCLTEEEAYTIEAERIKYWGRMCDGSGTLTNLAPGGSGKHPKPRRIFSQYTLEGKYVRDFNSQTEAENVIGVARSAIGSALKGRIRTAGGYRWAWVGEEVRLTENRHNRTPVSQYTLGGEWLADFPTVAAASRATKVKENLIHPCINGRSQCGGYFRWVRTGTALKSPRYKNISAVSQYTFEGKHLTDYPSIEAAVEILKCNRSIISAAAGGTRYTAAGYRWTYIGKPLRPLNARAVKMFKPRNTPDFTLAASPPPVSDLQVGS